MTMSKQQVTPYVDYRHHINTYIHSYFEERTKQAATIHENYGRLWTELSRIVRGGGKRLRPQIVMHAYHGLGGQSSELVIPIAAATELLHLSMLVHDDIIDRDDIRHGVDNMTGSYKKLYAPIIEFPDERQHFAQSSAILAGDALLAGAYKLLMEPAIEPQDRKVVFDLFDEAVFKVIGGELLDTESSLLTVGSISSETVMQYKTTSYSFIAPLLIGAQLAHSDQATMDNLRRFGFHLGLAFQLQDDYIGVFSDEEKIGKSTISDLREGKKTRLVEYFYELASEQDRLQFEQYFGKPDVTVVQAQIIRDLLVESGAQQAILQAIGEQESAAREILATLPFNRDATAFFEELVTISTSRDA